MWKGVLIVTFVTVYGQEQQCTEENRVPSFKAPDDEIKLLNVTFNRSTDKLDVLFQAPVAKNRQLGEVTFEFQVLDERCQNKDAYGGFVEMPEVMTVNAAQQIYQFSLPAFVLDRNVMEFVQCVVVVVPASLNDRCGTHGVDTWKLRPLEVRLDCNITIVNRPSSWCQKEEFDWPRCSLVREVSYKVVNGNLTLNNATVELSIEKFHYDDFKEPHYWMLAYGSVLVQMNHENENKYYSRRHATMMKLVKEHRTVHRVRMKSMSRDMPFTLRNMGAGIIGLQICAVYDERWEMMPANSAEYANARASIVLPLALENASVMMRCSSLAVFGVIVLCMILF